MKILNKIVILIILISNFAYADQVIAMSDSLYKGKYFLISNSKKNTINTVIYKSVFRAGTTFSKMEINCSNNKYRKIGEGDSLNSIFIFPQKSNWISPVEGASHDDIVKFICKGK